MKLSKFLVRTLLGFATFLLASSATLASQELPSLGNTSSAILSEHQEQEIGQLVLKQLRATAPIESDPLVKYYVRKICYQIAEHSDLATVNLYPIIIRSEQFNAFAAPGGIIGINLGLFKMSKDVHEFASVIAHELAHLSQRHFARRLEKQKMATFRNLVGYVTSVALIASGAPDSGLATLFGTNALADAAALGYSRVQEREADRVGLNTLERAGFDPYGASRMFERMQQAYRFRQEIPEYLSTHPITQSRVADMRSDADKIPRGIYPDSIDYQFVSQRVSNIFFQSPREALAFARANNQPYLLAISASNDLQHELAIDTIEGLQERFPNNILIAGTVAEIYSNAGRSQDAIDLLKDKLELYPENQPLSEILAKTLTQGKRFDEAVELLWELTNRMPNDQDLWYQLAEVAGLAKEIVDVHRARAEFFILRGNYKSAITQLRMARNKVADENRLAQSLDQRLEDVRNDAERVGES